MGHCRGCCAEYAEGAGPGQQHQQKPLPQVTHRHALHQALMSHCNHCHGAVQAVVTCSLQMPHLCTLAMHTVLYHSKCFWWHLLTIWDRQFNLSGMLVLLSAGAQCSSMSTAQMGTTSRPQFYVMKMNCAVLCRRPVLVDVYSIGMFKFKGVMGMYNVVQIMPSLLAGRNEHIPASLPRGKATCVTRDIERLSSVTVYLPDYEQAQLHGGNTGGTEDTVQTPVGSMTHSASPSLLVSHAIA